MAHNEFVLTVCTMWSSLPYNPMFRGDPNTCQAIIFTEATCVPTTVDTGTAEGLLVTNATDFKRDPRHGRIPATPTAAMLEPMGNVRTELYWRRSNRFGATRT